MSNPSSSTKTLTPSMIAALVGLLALAIATVTVVLNKDDKDQAGGSSASATTTDGGESSSGAESSSEGPVYEGTPGLVTSAHGVSYEVVGKGYDELLWGGPSQATIGSVTVSDTTSYQACKPSAGTDLFYGLIPSDDGDLASAAESVVQSLAESVWDNSDVTVPITPEENTTDTGVTGQLTEITAKRADGADGCGTTASHIGAFAFKNGSGQTIVMVGGYRQDGEALKDADGFNADLIDTFHTLKVT